MIITMGGLFLLLGCFGVHSSIGQTPESTTLTGLPYVIVDTGQAKFYTNSSEIAAPQPGAAFYGQDAGFIINSPAYQDNGDGTVTDLATGLMWQQDPGDKKTFTEAASGASTSRLAGYSDWRLPTIKELYSLILFSGIDPSGPTSPQSLVPFLDTKYFRFEYGDESAGERIIDSQFASATKYVGTTMGGDETLFGVNFADGRIKGYGLRDPRGNGEKTFFVLYVRDNILYGQNDFINNNDGTITDAATGLMWSQLDSGAGMDWEDALAWAQQKNTENHLGYSDWRLPTAKELQSIVDYSRSPDTTNSAAIDPIFRITEITNEGSLPDYPCFWTGTTHANQMNGGSAAYIAFGRGLGWMQPPFGGSYTLMDVHGAGCQRSDPKSGDPGDWPYGHGPQGDVIRIYNFVRLVRGGDGQPTPPVPVEDPKSIGKRCPLDGRIKSKK